MSSSHPHSPTLKVKLHYLKNKQTVIQTTYAKCHSGEHITLHTPTLKQAQLYICSEKLSESFPRHMHVLQKLWRRSHYRARYACRTQSQGHESEGKSLIPLMRRGWLGGGTSLSLSLGKTAKQLSKKLLDRKQVFCSADAVDKTGRAG